MTAALSRVMGRMAELRQRVGDPRDRGVSFAAVLERAEARRRPAATQEAGSVSRLLGEPGSERLIGMLGTPVRLDPGVTVSGLRRVYTPPAGDPGTWADALPERGRPWAPAIETAAISAGIDPRLLAALVWQESNFTPDAVSRSGAIGLAQLMPATAEGLGVDPNDPIQNLDGGARYLAWTLEEFGSLELGLAAYNAGPGNVRKAGLRIPDIPETQHYVPKVIGYYQRLGGTP